MLDPFCGSGTTLFAAARKGIPSLGIETNPLATFVSRVKTRHYDRSDVKVFESEIESVGALQFAPTIDPPALTILDKVFHPQVLKDLLMCKEYIQNIGNRKIRDLMFLGWLAILERVSNTFKEGNGIKYRGNGRARKPRKGTKAYYQAMLTGSLFTASGVDLPYVPVKLTLIGQYQRMLEDLHRILAEGTMCKVEPAIYEASALDMDAFAGPQTVSTAIFSPPYANCFDYFEIFKVELWMGGFIQDYRHLREMRAKSLRSHLNVPLDDLQGQATSDSYLESLLSLMQSDRLWDKRIPRVVRGYFADMEVVIQKLFSSLTASGRCIIVVGNSSYGNVLVPTDLLLCAAAARAGFSSRRVLVARHLTTSSQQKKYLEPLREYLRESILILKRGRR